MLLGLLGASDTEISALSAAIVGGSVSAETAAELLYPLATSDRDRVYAELKRGQVTDAHLAAVVSAVAVLDRDRIIRRVLGATHAVLSVVSGTACTYHGYKRTGSALWALAWGGFGWLLPYLALPLACAQDFGKPKR